MLTCYSSHSGDQKGDLKPNLNILFCVLSHVGGTDSRACAFLFPPKLTCLTPRVCMCAETLNRNFSLQKLAEERGPECAPKKELTMWLLIGTYFDSVFHAAYRHGSSVGLCLRGGVGKEGGQSGRLCRSEHGSLTRTSAYQWVGLRRHGSSRRHRSFGRPNPPSLHGPISKSCS